MGGMGGVRFTRCKSQKSALLLQIARLVPASGLRIDVLPFGGLRGELQVEP